VAKLALPVRCRSSTEPSVGGCHWAALVQTLVKASCTWFHRVLVNRCIDRQRQVKRGGRGRDAALDSIAEPADERPNAADRLASDDRDRQVRQAVADLPERQRIALTLCAFEGHSNAEAGDIMGLGVKAIEALLVRARRQLRDALDPSLLDLAG
ncbi:MAG: sigma-70 family RNA polymerase sigma factor, partial [Pseudomonadota bacterium]